MAIFAALKQKKSMNKLTIIALAAALVPCANISAQSRTLTLEECRTLAIESDNNLKESRVKTQMASYDRKIAAANYFPNISVKGGYLHNGDNISLVSDEQSAKLTNIGTIAGKEIEGALGGIVSQIMSNPAAMAELNASPIWQTVMGAMSKADISTSLNAVGGAVNDALHMDVSNIGGAMASIQQPVFVGGKIIAANKIARLAEDLSKCAYDKEYRQVIADVDGAYWQVVSTAAKKALCDDYCDLLNKMLSDAQAACDEGVTTQAELLSVKVKANEASMLKTRATNGLRLSKMLLCKLTGLPLDSDIMLADEGSEDIAMPTLDPQKSPDEIYASRPELRQLDLAGKIYDKKVAVVRADMMPTVALTANYIYTNPNVLKGFSKDWAGTWNAGVIVSIPIFHGAEALNKTRKAKAEATLYKLQLENAKSMVNLQVSKLRANYDEALERYSMSKSNLDSAEENLRSAMVGFENGVVPANTTMAAQAAWLQAHSDYIDAGIELRMTATNINIAEGNTL